MEKKISITIGPLMQQFGDREALRLCAEAGFDGVDFSMNTYPQGVLPDIYEMPHEDFVTYFKDLKAYADSLGLKIPQTHSLVDAYTPDREKNKILRRHAIRDLEATALLGCKYCVIHCISTFQWRFETSYETMHEENQMMYADFVETAEKFGVNITLESFGSVTVKGVSGYDCFADADKMLKEYEDLPTKNKAFCFDCGHTHVAAKNKNPDVVGFVEKFGDRIKVLHLHDNNGYSDQHLIPGFGTIPWDKLFEALDEIGYEGYYNFELYLRFAEYNPDFVKVLAPYFREFIKNPKRFRI